VIPSLADAWRWYESARELAVAMRRLGTHHWQALPWDGPLGRDDYWRELDADILTSRTQVVLNALDDLCVLLLFSVFEATVRDRVLAEIQRELPEVRHAVLQRAVAEAREGVEHGSFFRVLAPYKPLDADLIEEVNQVRRYRNWVAHGRRGDKPVGVDPRTALDRLQRFLDRFMSSPPPDTLSAE
jgi:hypothetical protein